MPNNRKLHCKYGHAFVPENCYWIKNGKYLKRECLTCRNNRDNTRYLLKRNTKKIAVRKFNKPTPNDLSWCGGLFEGEGTITMSLIGGKTRSYLTISRIIVGNTDVEVVNVFKNLWGGNLRARKKINGKKQSYEWKLEGSQTWIFLNDLLPYLKTQRVIEKAKLLIEAEEFRRRSPKTSKDKNGEATQKLHEYLRKFRLLNKRGD